MIAPSTRSTTTSGAADRRERTLADDVLDGLTRPFKELPPKHFYDARGAELFDQICELPEYYPTRCERAILRRVRREIAARTGATELVELGSGTASKTRVLLERDASAGTLERYVPLDVTESMVRARRAELVDEYPGLRVHGDRRRLRAPPRTRSRRRAGPAARASPSSAARSATSTPGSRRRFLRAPRRAALRPGDVLLLGTDLVKDLDVIEAAYDDAAGVTAEFNRNVLHVLNRELDADFAPEHSSTSRSSTASASGSRCACARAARPQRRGSASSASTIDVRARRGAAHRDLGEVHARARAGADFAAAGLELAGWFTDDDGLFAL